MELLERLAIKEVSIKIPTSTELLRLEADFYTSYSITFKKSLLGEDIIDFVQYGTSEELNEENNGYPILRLNEFELNFIKTPTKFCNKINYETYESLKLYKNDVLICRTNGNPKLVGKSAIVQEDFEYAYASYLFKIRPKKELINSATLVTFLNCKYGRMEIEKHSMVGNQANFSPAKFREINIPIFDKELNLKIEKLTFESSNLLEKSQNLFNQAETLLLQEIGLEIDPLTSNELVTGSNPGAITNTNVKSFKESFGVTGRLDAEYYQSKYEDLIEVIKSYENGYTSLETFIDNYSTGFPYKSETYCEEGIPLIRINNISKGNLDLLNAANIPFKDIHLSEKDIAVENDILISMSGTIGNSCRIPKGIKAVVNQRIMRVTPKDFNSEVLSLLINSTIGYLQLERIGTGGVQTNISATDIRNILIPKINETKQQEIAELIEESFSLKQQSEHLLEVAKKAVEMAIEESEEVAMKFINENI